MPRSRFFGKPWNIHPTLFTCGRRPAGLEEPGDARILLSGAVGVPPSSEAGDLRKCPRGPEQGPGEHPHTGTPGSPPPGCRRAAGTPRVQLIRPAAAPRQRVDPGCPGGAGWQCGHPPGSPVSRDGHWDGGGGSEAPGWKMPPAAWPTTPWGAHEPSTPAPHKCPQRERVPASRGPREEPRHRGAPEALLQRPWPSAPKRRCWGPGATRAAEHPGPGLAPSPRRGGLAGAWSWNPGAPRASAPGGCGQGSEQRTRCHPCS